MNLNPITLTGATMDPNQHHHHRHHQQQHHHSHSHGHDHQGHVEMMTASSEAEESPSIDEVLNSTTDKIAKSLATLLRFGRYEAWSHLVQGLCDKKTHSDLSEIFRTTDDGGHTLMHWASKRIDDIRFCQTFLEVLKEYNILDLVNTASQDNVGMYPLHWACTEASIPHVALLIQTGKADMEVRDASGCTPLLIAAQYGQVEVVAFLLQKGANLQALDKSGDSALHWAAYKGSIQVCGLLTYYETLKFSTVDSYGQSPLHLAALRGNTSVVRYILARMPRKEKEILFAKDKNGRTPLDLAIHKKRPNVQMVLEEHIAALEDPRGHFLRKTMWIQAKEFVSPKAWAQWMGMTGIDEMDAPMRGPFYYMLANFFLHFGIIFTCFVPVFNPGAGLMWDKSGSILLNIFLMLGSWYFFYKTWKTSPGYVDESHPHIGIWRQRYEETLEKYAYAMDKQSMDALPQLCHTCHIARPYRSKHCQVSRKCVLLFDHYCPFVDNTIGLWNYKYFFGFLVFTTFGLLTFLVTFFSYVKRYHAEYNVWPWVVMMIGLELAICLFPAGGLTVYHVQLTLANLTTNEHINLRKYKYMFDSHKKYRNPWFKGYMGNFMDRMQPSHACYMIAQEHQPLAAGDENV